MPDLTLAAPATNERPAAAADLEVFEVKFGYYRFTPDEQQRLRAIVPDVEFRAPESDHV